MSVVDHAAISVGDPIPPLERTIGLTDMVAYAGATWDWHKLHYDQAYVAESRRLNDEGMRTLRAGFDALRLRHLPSHGNFVLVDVGDGLRVFDRLLRAGVIVRPVANYGLPAWIRVTVGLPHENARLLAALPAALAQ